MAFLTTRTNNLQPGGPILQVIFVPPIAVAQQLQKEGKQVPVFRALALIDTGASHTCISNEIAQQLGLLPFDVQQVHTAAGQTEQLIYDIGIALPTMGNNAIAIQAPCADMSGQPVQALLGRDVLSRCTLYYNGPDNSFTIHS